MENVAFQYNYLYLESGQFKRTKTYVKLSQVFTALAASIFFFFFFLLSFNVAFILIKFNVFSQRVWVRRAL